MSASCSMAPDSLRSDSLGSPDARSSTFLFSCDRIMTGVLSSMAIAFMSPDILAISTCRDSVRSGVWRSCR